MKTPQKVRCAIYTRVSTDQGLDQEFNFVYPWIIAGLVVCAVIAALMWLARREDQLKAVEESLAANRKHRMAALEAAVFQTREAQVEAQVASQGQSEKTLSMRILLA